MKINTFRKYTFTADLYTFLRSSDAQGGEVLQYFFNRSISMRLTSSGLGGKFSAFLLPEDDDVIAKCQLFNIKDETGKELIENGVYQVDSVEPIINVWGRLEGNKARVDFFGLDG
jgi:hypothetical protein